MKKYVKLLSLVTAMVFLVTSVGYAAEFAYDDVMANTRREYSIYIDKATELLKADGIDAQTDKASILLMAEVTDFEDDDIEHSSIFVTLPDKASEDFYTVSFYSENKKHSGTAKNFDFGGSLRDLYSSETQKILERVDSPEEIVNIRIGGRLSFLAYLIEAKDEDYIIVYDKLNDTGANYNEMGVEEYEIEEGKIYTEDEFLKIIHSEEKAYKEYLKGKDAERESSYIDEDGDVKEKKPSGRQDDEICTCPECPDPECNKDPDDCDCDLADCTSEDCREDAAKKEGKEKEKVKEDKKENKPQKDYKDDSDDEDEICSCTHCPDKECVAGDDDCDCGLADCTSEDCKEDAAKKERRNKKSKEVKDYGVFKGDPDGDMRFEDTITRAEFAAVVCRMLGIAPGQADKMDELDFDDVDNDHWAKDYIKAARKAGIIDGKGDNKFDPEGMISNEEAIKMIIAAIGYSPKAEHKGGYPNGYVSIATELGVTDQIKVTGDANALRGDVMEMVYNSLDIPMMIEKQTPDSVEYEIADGTNGEEKTIRIILEYKISE